jgi:hypothetical protein
MGSAMLAAAAVEGNGDPAVIAREWLGYGDAVQPRSERKGLYATRFVKYERLLAALAGFPGDKEDL